MKFTLLGLIAAAPLLAACGGPATTVRYEPTMPPPVRLPQGLPKLYLVEVSDRSGNALHGPQGVMTQELNTNLADVLRDALLSELPRVGWPVAQTRALAGAQLRASMTKAEAKWGPGFNVTVKGEMIIDLVLEEMSGRTLWEGRLTGLGKGVAGGGGVAANGVRMAWKQALEQAIGGLGPFLASEQPWKLVGAAPAPTPAPAAAAPAAAASVARSELDELPAARPARKAHAVIIGVERYRENLPAAEFAAADARLAAEYFKRVIGVPESEIALLIDDRATRGDFEKYFERWLPNRVEAGDEVFIYYSGHGAPNVKSGDSYLVPFDGDPAYIEQTGYPVKKLYEQLAKLPAKRVLVAMDSCFSGAGGRSVIAKGSRPLVSVVAAEVPAKVTVLAASGGDQASNGYQEKGHGLFTYFLLKGLKEKGGDFKAVFDYLKPEVSKIARREYNADQDPQWREGK